MFNISQFLEKFSKNLKNTELQKEKIIEIVKNKTDISISKNEIEINNFILYIKSSPGVKNKLFIFKNSLLEEINNSIKITDIR
jgi:hypothetical protein